MYHLGNGQQQFYWDIVSPHCNNNKDNKNMVFEFVLLIIISRKLENEVMGLINTYESNIIFIEQIKNMI